MRVVEFHKKTYILEPGHGVPDGAIDLSSLSNKELVELHNLVSQNMGGGRVNRFSDSKSAVKRTLAKLVEFADLLDQEAQEAIDDFDAAVAEGEEKKTAKPASKARSKPKDEASARKKRGMRFVFPVMDEVKTVREGTMRHKLLELLSQPEGATFDECLAATWGQKKGMSKERQVITTYEGIRLLHYYTGYGMKQDENGRIKVFQ